MTFSFFRFGRSSKSHQTRHSDQLLRAENINLKCFSGDREYQSGSNNVGVVAAGFDVLENFSLETSYGERARWGL